MNAAVQSPGAHIALEAKAIANGRSILASAIEHGFTGPLDIPAEVFHAELQPFARVIREARDAGAEGYPDIVMFLAQRMEPGDQQDILRSGISELAQTPPCTSAMLAEGAARIVREHHRKKRGAEILWESQKRIADGDDEAEVAQDMIRKLAELEESRKNGSSLRERAYAIRYNPNEVPPPDEACLVIGGTPIGAQGNISGIQGKSKVGKSAVVAAILGAAQRGNYQTQGGDTLCINWQGESTGAIVHLDTEQSRSDWHNSVSRSVTRSGMPEATDRLVSLPLIMFARSERLEILKQTLKHEKQTRGSIDLVVIDGIADLCNSPNDETESLELISQVMALAQEYHTPIFCILHENPGSETGKTRGHIGSELNRKAFANLRIDKDAETLVSTIYGTDMRKRDIPKEQGFCFAWNDEAGMHTFQGRAAGLKAAQAEEKAIAKARDEWEPIYAHAAEIGTKTPCPELTPTLAAQYERDIAGTKKPTTPEAMKKRMQRAEALGVLKKSAPGFWTLSPSGQSGQNRDKAILSRA